MDEMLDLLHQKAYEETKKRNEHLSEDKLEEIAENIAISSFRFFLTKTDILKDITFDIDEVSDMEGETWAYVLYTNARIRAIIEKVAGWAELTADVAENFARGESHSVDYALLTHPLEIQLVKKIDELSSVLVEVVDTMAPHLLGRYLIAVCQLFNSYYNEVHIANSEENIKIARVALLQKTTTTLEKAMQLMGMKPVDRM